MNTVHRANEDPPPMKITVHDWKRLLEDAAFLGDELQALKHVIASVPARERPLEQESMIDIIAEIGHLQASRYLPAIRKLGNEMGFTHDQPVNGAEGCEKEEKWFDADQINELDTEDILNQIIHDRERLISMLEKHSDELYRRSIEEKEGNTTVYDLLSGMITFERKQLKRVTERVLAIDLERHTGPEHH